MRVLHIGLCKNKGGIESFAINYFRAMQPLGVIFDFVDIYGEGLAYADEIERLGGKIIPLVSFKKNPIRCKNMLKAYIKSNSYDAVHIHVQTTAYIFPITAAIAAGVKPIVHVHFAAVMGVLRKILHAINIRRLRRLDVVRLSCAEAGGRWFWGEREFSVLPNAINAEAFAFDNDKRQRIREELSLAEDDVVLGFVGRLESVKNPLFALEVIEKCKQRGLKAKLLMLGEGTLKTEIQKRISEKGLSDSVELIGYTPRVSDFLSAMDIYLMPSFSEAFSVSAIEAQTNGLHVLFSDRLSREMQILQNCRFIKLDADSFAAAIEKIRAENREGASEGILESIYNISHACEELLKIYEKSEVGAKA